uniref:8 kDa Amblyomma family member n=1 Tax=Rhipicephalus zambeziensis TaxID=60191 RepID=A0A224YKY5_9ACAR
MMSPVSVLTILLVSTCITYITEVTGLSPGRRYPQCRGQYCIKNEDGTSPDCQTPCNCEIMVGEGIDSRQGNCTNPKPREGYFL